MRGERRAGPHQVLALQRAAGNQAVARSLARRRVVARAHVNPIPSRGKWEDTPEAWEAAIANVKIYGGVLTPTNDLSVFKLEGKRDIPEGKRGVSAFVQPARAPATNEIWLLGRAGGTWNDALGSHGYAKNAPAVAAGELMWEALKENKVKLLAANTKTSVYELPPADPRATQSDVLAAAGLQRLTCFSSDEVLPFRIATEGPPPRRVEDPVEQMQPGTYRRDDAKVKEGLPASMKYVYTYHPTAADRALNEQFRQTPIPAAAIAPTEQLQSQVAEPDTAVSEKKRPGVSVLDILTTLPPIDAARPGEERELVGVGTSGVVEHSDKRARKEEDL